MRVLGLSTDTRWGASVLVLGSWLQALAAEGDVVALACVSGSALARGARAEWPRLSLREVQAEGWWRRTHSVREVVQALRPDAVLVYRGDDAAAAALAMGPRGPVVWRQPMSRHGTGAAPARSLPERVGWRQRTALARGLVRRMEPGLHSVFWPPPAVLDDETAPGVLRLADAAARTDTARSDGSLMVPPRVTLLLPPYLNDEGIHALRVLAALHRRHASLRVRLVADGEERGVAPLLQDARLHAAALGMAAAFSVQSLDAWLAEASRNEDVLWVVDAGDAGTLAVVEAMHRAIPVVASAARHYADLVLPGVTGLHLPQARSAPSALDDGAQLLSDLARVLGDAEWRSTMGAAGQRHLHRVRAPRAILHGLRVMLDPTSSPLA
ncbi:MAG: hypothetical protein IBJ19_13475 [Gemmatimonadaceae bacterium]|nr:hypothetical protein [Gemmatimonadaceae bacterium]